MKRRFVPIVTLLSVMSSLCQGENSAPATTSPGGTASAPEAAAPAPTDYSDPARWLALPAEPTKPVDIFYLSPTTFKMPDRSESCISAIDDAGMIERAKRFYTETATAFEPSGNVYAPYYRQADAGYCLALSPAEHERVMMGLPVADSTAAFAYYIEHYNQGRPFILAGYSQGSNVMLYLLSGYLKDHPEVYRRMIAAYAIGYAVTTDYLAANPHLKFATGPADTGVIISYNTEAPVIGGANPVTLPGSLAINPITWTTDETPAPAKQNLGSLSLGEHRKLILDPNGAPVRVPNYADATVNRARGVIICSTVSVDELAPGSPIFPRGVFHAYDYAFYYFDLRANAAERVAAYQAARETNAPRKQ